MTRPGPPLIDVTSSRFLGLRHARDSLPAWADLTTGVPAVLAEPPLAGRIAGTSRGGRAPLPGWWPGRRCTP